MIFDALPVPTTVPPSSTCTSNGADTVTQPAIGAETFGSEKTTEVVAPESTPMVRSAEPASVATDTLCSTGVRSDNVSGELPRNCPSTYTRAPDGSVATVILPVRVAADSAGASSKY